MLKRNAAQTYNLPNGMSTLCWQARRNLSGSPSQSEVEPDSSGTYTQHERFGGAVARASAGLASVSTLTSHDVSQS